MSKELMIFRASRFGFVAALLASPLIGTAAPGKSTNAPPQEVRSTFIIPNNPKEGRDPFFPTAISLYQRGSTNAAPVTTAADSLRLVGILGSSFANINGTTFGIGETQEVKTPSGPISVRLLQIKTQDESVIIEAYGQRRELKAGAGGLTHRY